MVEFDVRKAVSSHIICGVLHLTSTIVLRSVAGSYNGYKAYVSAAFWEYTGWRTHCYEATTKTYTAAADECDAQSQQVFSVTPPASQLPMPVNLLAMALTFTLVSSMVHFASACWLWKTKKGADESQQLRVDSAMRFGDYAVSASVMLSLMNIVFGANSVAGVILAPAVLGVALVLAAVLQWHVLPGAERPLSSSTATCYFVGLVLVYTLCLLPTILAMSETATVAPKGVLAFMVGMLIVFSSFIVPYTIELVKREYCMFTVYATLSVVAKAILHAFLAVSVLQQAKLYEAAPTVEAGGDPPEDIFAELQTKVYAILAGTIVGGIGLFFVLLKCFNPFVGRRSWCSCRQPPDSEDTLAVIRLHLL